MTIPVDVVQIVEGLSKAQRTFISGMGNDEMRRITKVHHMVYQALYGSGILACCLAGGFYFTCLTPLGLAVRAHLLGETAGG